MAEIDGKNCFSIKKYDFDKRTACGAPVHWSKYTTLSLSLSFSLYLSVLFFQYHSRSSFFYFFNSSNDMFLIFFFTIAAHFKKVVSSSASLVFFHAFSYKGVYFLWFTFVTPPYCITSQLVSKMFRGPANKISHYPLKGQTEFHLDVF